MINCIELVVFGEWYEFLPGLYIQKCLFDQINNSLSDGKYIYQKNWTKYTIIIYHIWNLRLGFSYDKCNGDYSVSSTLHVIVSILFYGMKGGERWLMYRYYSLNIFFMSRVFLAPDILNEMGRISMYNKNVAIILSISSHILIIPDIIDSHRKRRKAARVVKARHARHPRWRWISSAILRLRRTRTHLRSNPSTQINGNACDDDATVRHRRLPESGLQLMSETTV